MQLPQPKYSVTDKNHRYTIHLADRNIGPLKSVTSVLNILAKDALIGWAAREASKYFLAETLKFSNNISEHISISKQELINIAEAAKMAHRRKSDKAMELGTAAHSLFQAIVENKVIEKIPDGLIGIYNEFRKWRISSPLDILAQEIATGSINHGFGGRFDAIAWSKERGGFGIIDYKTSRCFYGNEYAFQVGGYAIAVEEQFDIEISWCDIARFSKEYPYTAEVRPIKDMKAAKEGFIDALCLSRRAYEPLIDKPSYESFFKEELSEKKEKINLPF